MISKLLNWLLLQIKEQGKKLFWFGFCVGAGIGVGIGALVTYLLATR